MDYTYKSVYKRFNCQTQKTDVIREPDITNSPYKLNPQISNPVFMFCPVYKQLPINVFQQTQNSFHRKSQV